MFIIKELLNQQVKESSVIQQRCTCRNFCYDDSTRKGTKDPFYVFLSEQIFYGDLMKGLINMVECLSINDIPQGLVVFVGWL